MMGEMIMYEMAAETSMSRNARETRRHSLMMATMVTLGKVCPHVGVCIVYRRPQTERGVPPSRISLMIYITSEMIWRRLPAAPAACSMT